METAQVLDPVDPVDPDEPSDTTFPLSPAARGLVAVLAIGAAAIHLVMVPSHAGQSLVEGLGFALSGWFAIAFALVVIARPTKRWLQLGILANVAFIGVWAVTRTAGLPFGAHPGHPEAAGFIDLTCVGLEVALILACAVLLRNPRLGEGLDTPRLVVASVVPLAVMALTTAVLASPSATNHASGSHGDHDGVAAGAGADHHAGEMDHSNGAMDHSNGDHAHPAAVSAASRCDWEFNTTTFWAQDPPAADDGHEHSHGSPNESADPAAAAAAEKETVGNKAGLQWWKPLTDPAQCAAMKTDLATMESFAKKYPTAKDAMENGCVRVTIYVPGIAAHYACIRYWDDKMDVTQPEMLLYGGSQPWAPLVGLSYYSLGGEKPGDDWQFGQMPFHVHNGLCVKGTLVIGGDGSSKESCEARGGRVMGKTGFMGHYWLPNCSSPDGVFSSDNPRLDMGVAVRNDDVKYDPAQGGDPTLLQADPCAGSGMTEKPAFGEPPSGATENAAGAPAAK